MNIRSRDASVRHLQREKWLGWLALVALWAAGVVPYFTVPSFPLLFCGMPLVLLGGSAYLLARNHGRSIAGVRDHGRPGTLTLDGDRLELTTGRTTRRLRRADVVSGWIETWPGFDDVVLQQRSGLVLRVALPPDVRARDVLTKAGVAPEQRAVTMCLGARGPIEQRTITIFIMLVLLLLSLLVVPIVGWMIFVAVPQGIIEWYIPLATIFMAVLGGYLVLTHWVSPLIPTTVRIGTDGVLVERLFRKRLLSRPALDHVTYNTDRVTLHLTDGTHVPLAAAAALSSHDQPEIRAGLRIAADTCVDDRVRIALTKAAGGTLEEADLLALTDTAIESPPQRALPLPSEPR